MLDDADDVIVVGSDGGDFTFTAAPEHEGERLDKVLDSLCPEYSRARIQALIKEGQVSVNGSTGKIKASMRLEGGESLKITLPELKEALPEPQNIPLDIVYEDDDLLVINKSVGLVVHPGAGNQDGTLVNALLYHCADSLSGIGGVMRPGIVHRLDKDTSGLMVVAKHDRAHQGLAAQLEDRTLSRTYLALVLKSPMPIKGSIDKYIGRHPSSRTKMAVLPPTMPGVRHALTHYLVKQNFNDALSLVECKLETGRTHQIRVHMDSIGHSLIGDPFYGPQPTALQAAMKNAGYDDTAYKQVQSFPRQALHAAEIGFIHPISEEYMHFTADMPDDLQKLIEIL